MVRHHGMQAVELVDADADAVPDAPVVPGTRRRSRRWLLVPALVAVGLVGAQAVVVAREHAADAALARVPGVVRPLDAQVTVRWKPPAGDTSVLQTAIAVGSSLVGLDRDDGDGSQAL